MPLERAPALLALLACLAAPHALANCTSPAGKETDVIYNGAYHTYQFCNGTNWIAMGPGGCFAPQSGAYQPTIPSGSGYFVLSAGTYNGNLGGPTGADATCLSDLTTNTGWKGYSTANANGQLVAAKVHAFLCDSQICNNLTPVTTYVFANAGDSSAGGASFTTDSSGIGPNDSADWAAANYFNGTYQYWTNMGTTSNTAWSGISATTNWVDLCRATSGSGDFTATSYSAVGGVSSSTNASRWNSGLDSCASTYHLICFVNP